MNSERKAIYLLWLGLLCSPVYAMNFRLNELLYQINLIGSKTDLFTSFLYQILPLAALYLIGIWITFRYGAGKAERAGSLYIIFFFAFLFRLLLVPTQPVLSTDMYRYIWDGRVQAHGINPYRYAPADKALEDLRDEAVYPRMNRHASPTIYPAGAQVLFHALNRVGVRSVSAFKGAVVLFDMGSVLILTMILAHLGLARERVLIYAWNPLVIFELGGSGHLEGFLLFLVLLSLLFLVKERPAASITSLALAASLKLYPVIILPAVLKDKKIGGSFLFGAVFLSLYLPYLGVGKRILGFLPEYFENPYESFNLGLKAYLLKLIPSVDQMAFTVLFAAILSISAAVVWIKQKDVLSSLRLAYILATLHTLLASASFHPWYALWIIPFLALFPSPAWLYFSFALTLSYLAYVQPQHLLPEWVRHVEYIPFFVLLALEYSFYQRPCSGWFPWRPAVERNPRTMQKVITS